MTEVSAPSAVDSAAELSTGMSRERARSRNPRAIRLPRWTENTTLPHLTHFAQTHGFLDSSEMLENVLASGIGILRVVRQRVEGHDDHRRSADVLECVHDPRRKYKAPHFVHRHFERRDLAVFAV